MSSNIQIFKSRLFESFSFSTSFQYISPHKVFIKMNIPIKRSLLRLISVLLCVHVYNSCRNRSKLKRKALLPPDQAPWAHLYRRGDNHSFFVITGVDRSCFKALLEVLFPDVVNFNIPVPPTKLGGRPSLPPSTKLGILLLFLCSMMHQKHLCLIFGVVPSPMGKIIDKMLDLCIEK